MAKYRIIGKYLLGVVTHEVTRQKPVVGVRDGPGAGGAHHVRLVVVKRTAVRRRRRRRRSKGHRFHYKICFNYEITQIKLVFLSFQKPNLNYLVQGLFSTMLIS